MPKQVGQPVGMLQSVRASAAEKAWLGLFAVAAGARRQGVGRALFEQARADWPTGTPEVEVLGIPGNYFVPGLDPRYTEALCFWSGWGSSAPGTV